MDRWRSGAWPGLPVHRSRWTQHGIVVGGGVLPGSSREADRALEPTAEATLAGYPRAPPGPREHAELECQNESRVPARELGLPAAGECYPGQWHRGGCLAQ